MANQKATSILALLFAVVLIASCGGSKLKVEPIAKSENPSELIQKLEKDVANARNDQINVLAPMWFARAENSLKAAKQGLSKGDKISTIMENIAKGRAELLTARDKAQVAHSVLAEAIKNRDLARTAGATSLGKDYAQTEEAFMGLTRAVEKNNTKYAKKNRQKVADRYRELEIRAIKIQTIGEVRKLLAQARKDGVHKIAPKTYTAAQKSLVDADNFITQNPYAKEKMHLKADHALFMAKRLNEVAQFSRKIEGKKPEEVTLLFESMLHQISQKLAAPDLRDQPFGTQVENILSTVEAHQYERSFMRDKETEQSAKIDKLENRIAALEGKTKNQQAAKERLLAERQFNQLFTKVQGYYESNEAEIYKSGNQLVVRLKGIEFPVGKSVILPKNYALLSKVKRTIRTFDDVDVVIEGHTDSTGSEEVNEHLSEQRADAVRQYLVANDTLSYDKIIAVGYGSMRPLASNKTQAGRAINRRIDLIITPHFEH